MQCHQTDWCSCNNCSVNRMKLRHLETMLEELCITIDKMYGIDAPLYFAGDQKLLAWWSIRKKEIEAKQEAERKKKEEEEKRERTRLEREYQGLIKRLEVVAEKLNIKLSIAGSPSFSENPSGA